MVYCGMTKTQAVGKSADDGTFEVTVPKGKMWATLTARMDGSLLDFVPVDAAEINQPVELRAVPDCPIRSTIVSPEGEPLAGVEVRVVAVYAFRGNSVDDMLAVWKKRGPFDAVATAAKIFMDETTGKPAAVTDADGRFSLTGLGADRFVAL